MRKFKKDDPRYITAKFDGVCAETGKKIKKGEVCIYYPSNKKVYLDESDQGYEFRCWLADNQMGCEW